MSQAKDSKSNRQPGEPKVWRPDAVDPTVVEPQPAAKRPKEFGGRKDGLDPTRYGDWEKNGRCIDF